MPAEKLFCSVHQYVFHRFPGYVRGVVVVHGLMNGESPSELSNLLRQAEYSVRQVLNIETINAHPRMAAWREAYRTMGTKPGEFRPSMEALARRALHGTKLPLINSLVDLGNVLSLRHLVPIGGHSIDSLQHDITLRPAIGNETFIPFGSQLIEHPLPNEIIFTEEETVLCRRWTWRQSNHTLVLPTTTAVEINVDGLPPVSVTEVENICKELINIVQHFCGGTARFEILTQEHPEMNLGLQN